MRTHQVQQPAAVQNALHGREHVMVHRRLAGLDVDLCLPVGTSDPIVNEYLTGHSSNDYMLQVMLQTTQPEDQVVDLGCHVGTFCLGAAAARRTVVALDASPFHVALVERSREYNRFDHMQCHWRAIDADRDHVQIVESGLFSRVVDRGTPGDIDVPASTLDRFAAQYIHGGVAFLKMDIEGAELAAIQSGRSFLESALPFILFESNGMTLKLANSSVDDLRVAFAASGYKTFRVEGDRWVHSPVGEVQPEGWVDMIALCKKHQEQWAARIDWTWEPEAIYAKCLAWSELPHENTRQYLLNELQTRTFNRSIETRIAELTRRLEMELAHT